MRQMDATVIMSAGASETTMPDKNVESTTASGSDDATETMRRQAIAAKIIQRAELSKTARHLQQRLALAVYKTQNGCASAKLEQLEPQVEQQYQHAMARKRRAEQEALSASPSKRAHIDPSSAGTDQPSSSSADLRQPHPPRMSLYDVMLTPSISSLYDAFASPHIGAPQPLRLQQTHRPDQSLNRKRSFVKTSLDSAQADTLLPTSPVSSARDETRGSLSQRGSIASKRPPSPTSHRRTGSLPGRLQTDLPLNSPSPFSPASAHISTPVRPLSTADPTFVKSAPEFVAAANALTSLNRGTSEDGMLSPVPENAQAGPSKLRTVHNSGKLSSPSQQQRRRSSTVPAKIVTSESGLSTAKNLKAAANGNLSDGSGSADAAGESDRESAAELMLYLATSPSPVSSNHANSPKRASMEPPAMSAKGRRLMFGDTFDETDLKRLEESAQSAANRAGGTGLQPALSMTAGNNRMATPTNSVAASLSKEMSRSSPSTASIPDAAAVKGTSPRKMPSSLPQPSPSYSTFISMAPPSHLPPIQSFAQPRQAW